VTVQLESTWTAPRSDCPRPDWWHATDDDSTEIEVSELLAGFVRALQPEIVVETGTAWGQTAELIGRALKANGHGHLYTTETNVERVVAATGRCAGLPVTVLNQESLSFTPPGPVGLAFFDSFIPIRVQEAQALRPWLQPGALLGFHDCGPQHGYRDEVEALAQDGWLRMIYLPTPRGVIFAEVLA
jgi:hypothetical protein